MLLHLHFAQLLEEKFVMRLLMKQDCDQKFYIG